MTTTTTTTTATATTTTASIISSTIPRSDFAAIANLVKTGSKVLDLGCGDGSLLRYLRDTRDIHGYGVN